MNTHHFLKNNTAICVSLTETIAYIIMDFNNYL